MADTIKPAPSLSGIIRTVHTGLALAPPAAAPLDIVHEGWLLKKKRKKLQGYARRYFVLRNNGTFSYSLHPGDEKIRDQILLINAAFSSSPANRSIHVDSGQATFHLRTFTQEDYDKWMESLRQFITMPRPMSAADGTLRHSIHYARTVNFSIGHATKMNTLLDDMGQTIKELREVIQLLSEQNTASVRSKREHPKESSKDAGILGLFSKSKPPKPKHEQEESTPVASNSPSVEFPEGHIPPTLQGALQGISSLETQHKQVLTTFQSLLHLDSITSPIRAASPSLPSHGEWAGMRVPSRAGTLRRTMSVGTTSDDSLQWFDADDGPEEYVLEEPEAELETDEGKNIVPSDAESESEKSHVPGALEAAEPEDLVASPQTIRQSIKRRSCLPAPVTGDEMSLLTVLRKNVGKDLSQIALPIGFNEPISILQRLAEDLEYIDLIEQAVATEDSVQRLCLVTAFAISGYACTRLRAARKPSNPMLGETFEDARFNFVAEKVSHNPPVMACHASGDGWSYDVVTQAKQKFWGRSLEIIPMGTTKLTIGNDVFTWGKPSSFMRNIVAGTKYLEHVGPMKITNESTGARCEVEFKESGMWGSSNVVSAVVFSPSNKVEAKLEGKWHESMARVLSRNQLEVLWRANDLPPQAQEYYGFTYFAMTLNEITEDLIEKNAEGKIEQYLIPLTDSRFRPDQRALEEGRVDDADEIKVKVEEMQRVRRRAGKDARPKWFKQVGQDDTAWEYAGGYWEKRTEGWGKQESLW
ncbi:hypothetical protein FRC14_005023 [Serendipita sp. 396]|nr:hypothetical protein FRC14_005023 [Serendipita sp. 396]